MMFDSAKIEDEAAFEDWSEWRSLDGRRERRQGDEADYREYLAARKRGRGDEWSRYYCIHAPERARFEICIPFRDPALTMVRRIPGATIDRRMSRRGDPMFSGCYIIPATSWRDLRIALPAIKSAVIAYVARAHNGSICPMTR